MQGTTFGRYQFIELLGRGGMGEVWRAYDTETQRVVAVKVLPANLANDPTFEQRFRREALAAAGLNDPHVVPIHHFGEIEGRLYVDMRLVVGRDLQAIIAEGPLDPERAVNIIEQIASALRAAHRIGLVHRDVKPSNILVTEDDFAYLIDFGIARAAGDSHMTGTGNVIGTWAYMAPERVTTGQTDPSGDTYALGCVLHECLTGSQPFPGNSLEQQIGGHLSLPPPRPSAIRRGIPEELDNVVATAMAKTPQQRYPTVTDMAAAAREAVTGTRPIPLRRPEPVQQRTQLAPPPKQSPPGPPPPRQPPQRRGGPGYVDPSQRRPPPEPQRRPAPEPTPYRQPSDPKLYRPPVEPSPQRPATDPTQRRPNLDPHQPRHPNEEPTQFRVSGEPAPPAAPPSASETPPAKPGNKRRTPLILAGAGVLLVVIAVVAGIALSGGNKSGDKPATDHSGTGESFAAPSNGGPFTGTYTADFGPKLSLAGKEVANSEPPAKETWVLRSACTGNNNSGCVATAQRTDGPYNHTPKLVFDDVRGRWIAVALEGGNCNDKPIEKWNYVWLQPHADGTMVGEWITDSLDCYSKRSVTFTRVGDGDLADLPDPAEQSAREISPAQALHGFYHLVTTYTGPNAPKPQEADYNVDTICLRTGDRCLSRFVRNGSSGTQLLLFANNVWTRDDEYDASCPAGGTSHVRIKGTFPLPEPQQDPIMVLTGSGTKDESGSACKGGPYDMKFNRTGG
ncbi:MAG: serine/threonine protein kinase [Mycobacterium sp.]|uniref:serine/threonine-protein kinase n=1 Tax=Mycobacterium sp. TaxID=1785 RepID=UPI000CC50982|nr:serine/threonine-protein kinase [Mycobacterium sp.]PJE01446.1 MAG: serine/threonine protein kinase [Mycobacterium sp.]PJE05165.1 MAG: serine/threonine protein kinase [Mycobacterium sp.]